MLRHVIVCLDDRATGVAARDSAIRFARGYGASLTGILAREPGPERMPPVVGLAPHLLVSTATATVLEQLAIEHERREDEREASILHVFREACHRGTLTPEWRVVTGRPAETLARSMRAVDLVVAGRGELSDGQIGTVALSLVRHLAQPVMLVGRELDPVVRIGVAYDGSPGADRALALAADIAWHWKGQDVAVVPIAVGAPEERLREALADAERYLDIYHLAHHAHALDGPVADLIVETGERERVDLLVMGAFGHTRLHEIFAGSTTRAVIARWKGSLLLCH